LVTSVSCNYLHNNFETFRPFTVYTVIKFVLFFLLVLDDKIIIDTNGEDLEVETTRMEKQSPERRDRNSKRQKKSHGRRHSTSLSESATGSDQDTASRERGSHTRSRSPKNSPTRTSSRRTPPKTCKTFVPLKRSTGKKRSRSRTPPRDRTADKRPEHVTITATVRIGQITRRSGILVPDEIQTEIFLSGTSKFHIQESFMDTLIINAARALRQDEAQLHRIAPQGMDFQLTDPRIYYCPEYDAHQATCQVQRPMTREYIGEAEKPNLTPRTDRPGYTAKVNVIFSCIICEPSLKHNTMPTQMPVVHMPQPQSRGLSTREVFVPNQAALETAMEGFHELAAKYPYMMGTAVSEILHRILFKYRKQCMPEVSNIEERISTESSFLPQPQAATYGDWRQRHPGQKQRHRQGGRGRGRGHNRYPSSSSGCNTSFSGSQSTY